MREGALVTAALAQTPNPQPQPSPNPNPQPSHPLTLTRILTLSLTLTLTLTLYQVQQLWFNSMLVDEHNHTGMGGYLDGKPTNWMQVQWELAVV